MNIKDRGIDSGIDLKKKVDSKFQRNCTLCTDQDRKKIKLSLVSAL